MTWVALVGEIVALPLCLWKKGRPIAWTWMLTMHVGIALVVDFADLTLGMMLAHLFVFDPRWLPARSPGVRRVVFFDGVCALCDGSMRFLIGEDRERLLKYAPLQGETAAREPGVQTVVGEGGDDLRSAIYVRGPRDGREVFTRSDAILAILDDLGGFWRVIALARFVPRPLRDGVYNVIARYRYRWFGRLETCRLPDDTDAGLFLD